MSPLLHLFNKDTQILLTYSAPQILLKCYYDGVAASIGLILEKWPLLFKLHEYFPKASDKQSVIPVDKLDQIRELLLDLQRKIQQQGKIQITIDNTVMSFVVRNAAPDDFIVRYEREGDHLNRIMPKSVTETVDGWLLRGYEFWNYPALDKKNLRRFQKSVIGQNDLLLYTRNYFPVFRQAGIRMASDIEYVNTPSVLLTLHSIYYDHISIRPIWSVSPDSIDEMFSIPYHVVSGGTLREGLSPRELKQVLADVRGDTDLEDDRIAEFHDHWYPIWKKWINGDTADFERMHRWIKPPFHWILQVQSNLIHGVGKAYASPVACIDKERLSVDELEKAQEKKYFHLSTGWVLQEDLKTLDLNENGSCIQKGPSEPFQLDTAQMLCKGNHDIRGPWRGMVIDGLAWTDDGNKHDCAEKHLQYLLYWGLNGGLVGGYETFVTYGMPILYEHIKKYPDCEILILGCTEDIERLRQEHLRLSHYDMRIHVESFDQNILRDDRYKTWNIVAVIEPEVYFAESSRLNGYSRRIRILASCILCFPYAIMNKKGSTQQWMTDLLGYKENAQFENYLIRDCRKRQSMGNAAKHCYYSIVFGRKMVGTFFVKAMSI